MFEPILVIHIPSHIFECAEFCTQEVECVAANYGDGTCALFEEIKLDAGSLSHHEGFTYIYQGM